MSAKNPAAHLPTDQGEHLPPVRHLRHRAEVPMLLTATTLLAIAMLVVVVMVVDGLDAPGWLRSIVVVAVVGPVLASVVFARYQYWATVSNAVEVTADQLPELHQIFVEQAARLGMTPDGTGMGKTPRLYLVNGNGVMNAYATKCRIRRGYVVIYSDLLDLAYQHGHFDLMRFVLGHELGHHHCGHTQFRRLMLQGVLRPLQLWPSFSRAQEYTADRVGAFLSLEGAPDMIGLYAGKHMQKDVRLEPYFASVERHKDGFWLKVANFRADHPVGFRRMTTLRRMETEGWDVHGTFF
ncbi:M48 family metallopeptidase [Aeromicrobium sp. Leaf350]|uniref:M48 family metallopeptidase n=1 Tax=Aeromicrobium sp. Leaf350 TaxID=2876565 RepID=UPI001E586C0B|nr:M48 family metallopeptidase [Aeromicrobium sp. Leaf350]